MKNFVSFLICILVLAFTAWYLLEHVFITEETRIQRVIEKGKRSIQGGSYWTIPDMLTADYRDRSGLEKEGVLYAIKSLIDQTSERQIHILRTEIEIQSDREALATVRFLFFAQIKTGNTAFRTLLTETADEAKIAQIRLKKEKNKWKIASTAVQSR